MKKVCSDSVAHTVFSSPLVSCPRHIQELQQAEKDMVNIIQSVRSNHGTTWSLSTLFVPLILDDLTWSL